MGKLHAEPGGIGAERRKEGRKEGREHHRHSWEETV